MKRSSRLSVSRRSGCATCKERHKKCDEQKPRCKNCTRLNLECKQADPFRASELSTTKPRRVTRKLDKMHSSVGNRSNPRLINAKSRNASNLDAKPPTLTNFPPTPQVSTLEGYLRQHYIERLSSVLVNVDGPSNSLRCVILPRALVSPMLMDAIYATSSLHIFIWNKKSEHRISSLTYYNKAAAALHRLISNVGAHSTVEDRELSLLTSVFLCKYEIISGGLSNWRSHLQGLQKMFGIFQQNQVKLSFETESFVQSFIAYHWYIAGITRTQRLSTLSTTPDTDQNIGGEIILGNQIDLYMGISGTFIFLLHSAAQIIMFDFVKKSDLSTIMSKVTDIYYQMRQNARASKQSNLYSGGLTTETIAHLDYIANAYRNAVIVYLHTILDIVEGQNVSDASVVQCFRIRSLLYSTKDDAISACVENIMRVPEDSSPALGLSPLLFIVASETRNQTEFHLAFRRLNLLWERTCLGNIGMARELLERIRQANCLDWRQVLKPKKWDLIIS